AVLGTAAILILYAAARNLVRRNPLLHRPGIGVKLGSFACPKRRFLVKSRKAYSAAQTIKSCVVGVHVAENLDVTEASTPFCARVFGYPIRRDNMRGCGHSRRPVAISRQKDWAFGCGAQRRSIPRSSPWFTSRRRYMPCFRVLASTGE